MANHKRKRAPHQRAGCLLCKPHKDEREGKATRQAASVRRVLQPVAGDDDQPCAKCGGFDQGCCECGYCVGCHEVERDVIMVGPPGGDEPGALDEVARFLHGHPVGKP